MALPQTMAELAPYLEAVVGEMGALDAKSQAQAQRIAELEAALLSQQQATDEAMRRAEEARRWLAEAMVEMRATAAQRDAAIAVGEKLLGQRDDSRAAHDAALLLAGEEIEGLKRERGIYYRALQRIAVADDPGQFLDVPGVATVARRALDGIE